MSQERNAVTLQYGLVEANIGVAPAAPVRRGDADRPTPRLGRRGAVLCAAIVLCLWGTPAFAQPWSGIIAPARATNWLGNAPGAGAIPTTRTQCGTTIAAYSGSAATINNAIAACGTNQYVKLNVGTFTLSTAIDFGTKNNVTLRGSGPDQTFVQFTATGFTGCNGLNASVCVAGDKNWWSGNPINTPTWTHTTYAQNTTTVTFSAVTNLAAGQIVILDQLNDTVDDGAIYNCFTTGACIDQSADTGRSGRGQAQTVLVTSVNTSTRDVTFAPSLMMPNWRTAQTPGAWYSSSAPRVGIGIEDISFDYSLVPNGSGGTTRVEHGMQMHHTRNSWVKNIRSINTPHKHITIYLSSNITVRDSYFYGTQAAVSDSYGIEPWNSGNILIENNIVQHVVAAFLMSTCSNCVVGYNYNVDDFYVKVPDWMQGGLYGHEPANNYILWEGNDSVGYTMDNIHGHANFNTAFRNRIIGWETGKAEQTLPVHIYILSRNHNIIGNVLGHPGYHTVYETYTGKPGATQAQCYVSIFGLGYGGNCQTSGGPTFGDDVNVRNSLMRWGNWDSVNNAVRFNPTEVPSTLALYPNPVPASQALPASLYLTSRPAWWTTAFGTPAWPPIGPDVTGGDLTDGSGAAASLGGHAYKIPARLCFENTPRVNNVLTFNADNCYSASPSSSPSPPTNPALR